MKTIIYCACGAKTTPRKWRHERWIKIELFYEGGGRRVFYKCRGCAAPAPTGTPATAVLDPMDRCKASEIPSLYRAANPSSNPYPIGPKWPTTPISPATKTESGPTPEAPNLDPA